MDPKLEWLNTQIDFMQADRKLDPHAVTGYEADAEDIAMLQVAAQLSASRPDATTPDGDFLKTLRARMLASVIE